MKQIAVLGSTGSIGTSSLDVIAAHPDRLSLFGVAARSSWQALAEQTRRFAPKLAVLTDESCRETIETNAFHPETELLFGEAGIERLVTDGAVETVVSGIVGAAGLKGTWSALEAGKDVALANKETLVVAGPLMVQLSRQTGGRLLPVDSEHSALFQCLQAGRIEDVRRLILTASGGPFRGATPEELRRVTPQTALAHPTWNMGPKITVDSATMMNKALEVIEARWLFGIDPDRISVVIHPQSVVHSLVEFNDGSVIAQLSPPDMKLPIQYALTYPERWDGVCPRLDLTQAFSLDFEPPDSKLFPALELGFEVARRGGTCGAVLNAANEVAVAKFLAGELEFCQISQVCRERLEAHEYHSNPTLNELFALDAQIREETMLWPSC